MLWNDCGTGTGWCWVGLGGTSCCFDKSRDWNNGTSAGKSSDISIHGVSSGVELLVVVDDNEDDEEEEEANLSGRWRIAVFDFEEEGGGKRTDGDVWIGERVRGMDG